jgi:thiol-disulfide isomerase/thioredoxin
LPEAKAAAASPGRPTPPLDVGATPQMPRQPPVPIRLRIGDPAPPFTVLRPDGSSVTLETLGAGELPLLIVFTRSSCPACEALQPALGRWSHEHASRLRIVPIRSRSGEASTEPGDGAPVFFQEGHEVAEVYGIDSLPSAILVSNGVVASSLIEGIDGITRLVVRTVHE